jgi:hypothetical protein
MPMNKSYTTFPIVSVPFSSGYYMCVQGSARHETLNRANHAFNMGYRDLAEDLKQEALTKPGCAFEARENNETNF